MTPNLSERQTMPMPPFHRGQVLIVDDDPNCVRGLSVLLSEDGFSVRTASNGDEALAIIEQEPPDAIVSDIDMPGLDGFGLLRAVRMRYPEIVMIMISGTHHGSAVLEQGALAYVGKPIQIDEIVSMLDAGLQLRQERREGRLSSHPRSA